MAAPRTYRAGRSGTKRYQDDTRRPGEQAVAKALLVHLSDIHVRSDTDPILSRVEPIVAAVQNLEYQVDAAIIAVSGDLAFAGSEPQYFAVWTFLDNLRSRLVDQLTPAGRATPTPVTIVAIPGNHDCNFAEPKAARPIIIQSVLDSPEQTKDQSVVDICLEVQAPFFEALEGLGNAGPDIAVTSYDRRLSYEYRIPIGDKTLRFLCLNTAWLSQRHEDQGKLYLPADTIPARGQGDTIVVAMFHHPYNWMGADAAQAFRRRIEATADLILTGHEHNATVRAQQTTTGERNLYIEGGALQESSNPDDSAFNAFVLDLTQRKQKTIRLAWNGERYTLLGTSNNAGDAFGLMWEELQVTRLRESGGIELAECMSQDLDDPGIELAHRGRSALRLGDIFIFPDLREIIYPPHGVSQIIRSSRVGDLILDAPRLLITGESQSGKTSFAKMAFRHLHAAGYVPVLLDGVDKPPTGERLHARLVELFGEQYSSPSKESYRQLDRARRAIIVDNYHRLEGGPQARRSFVKALTSFANKVILLADDLASGAADLLQPRGRADGALPFAAFHIEPFGHARRAELVDRWLLLDENADANADEFVHRRETTIGVFNSLIGRHWLPAYPVYMLAILESSATITRTDTRISTYGAYYELLIRGTLARSRTPVQSEITLSYLAHFAYHLFRDRVADVDNDRFNTIHREFEQRYDISRSAEAFRSDLAKCGVFTIRGDTTRFKYPYIYYYFVASWIRDHIDEPAVREVIKELSRSVHIEEHANILLFLAHLSKNPLIVRELLAAARSFYPDTKPAALADDIEFFLTLKPGHSEVVYEEQNLAEARARRLEALDEEEATLQNGDKANVPDDEPTDDTLGPVTTLTAAAKTLQILGQILKNFPGSLEGDVKFDIAGECYSLGLRTLASIYDALRANSAEIVDDMIAAIKAESPRLQDKELEERALKTIVGLAEIIGLYMVRLVAASVGSKDLSQTYKRVIEQGTNPAILLIDTSIRLDHSVPFPDTAVQKLAEELRKEPFARQILAYLIVGYFHMFPVEMAIKQRVCAALGIKYTALIGADATRKLLPDSRSGN